MVYPLARGGDKTENTAMYPILTFATEDVYFPPECRIDDIPGWLAPMRDYEDTVKTDLLEAFGKAPAALSRHNDYFGPQHVPHPPSPGWLRRTCSKDAAASVAGAAHSSLRPR